MDNQINFIREMCIKVNPEILELKFGCEIEMINDGLFYVVGTMPDGSPITVRKEGAYDKSKNGATVEQFTGIKEIIGRPIRLADVLLALNVAKKQTAIQDYGCFMVHGYADDEETLDWHEISNSSLKRVHWNLKQDDLSLQSKETIAFIYELLK